jgi:hypothetical protein
MAYTVWLHGQQIGETKFEFRAGGMKHAGAFHPTAFGVTVLPSITAMGPALFDFGDMCRLHGIDTDDPSPENASNALDTFASTPEGKRVMAAAKQIASVQVRDPEGQLLAWDSLAITDLEWLVQTARERNPSVLRHVDDLPEHDPVRFMISLTLKEEARSSVVMSC